MTEFVKERNEALFSLDKDKILACAEKYQVPMPTNELGFWGGVYKAILGITNAPEDKKQIARKWLREHGMSENMW